MRSIKKIHDGALKIHIKNPLKNTSWEIILVIVRQSRVMRVHYVRSFKNTFFENILRNSLFKDHPLHGAEIKGHLEPLYHVKVPEFFFENTLLKCTF